MLKNFNTTWFITCEQNTLNCVPSSVPKFNYINVIFDFGSVRTLISVFGVSVKKNEFRCITVPKAHHCSGLILKRLLGTQSPENTVPLWYNNCNCLLLLYYHADHKPSVDGYSLRCVSVYVFL